MTRQRIIPVLLTRGPRLVKTTQFTPSKDRYIGCPINAARIFSEKEADELIVLDIEASLYNRRPNFEFIKSIAEQCSMPFCYGGGIRTIDEAKRIIRSGAEKVSINSAAYLNPKLITEMATEFGSQSVIVSIDIKKKGDEYVATYFSSQVEIQENVMDLILRYQCLGAGEILLNFIDRDGIKSGYDFDFLKKLEGKLSLPLTVVGGASGLENIKELGKQFPNCAAGVGSLFVYSGTLNAVLINYPTVQQKQELHLMGKGFERAQ